MHSIENSLMHPYQCIRTNANSEPRIPPARRDPEVLVGGDKPVILDAVQRERTAAGEEVDSVVEAGDDLLPIEVKATERPCLRDAARLRSFRAEYGPAARPGILLHAGTDIEWIAPDVLAAPWWRVLQPAWLAGLSAERAPHELLCPRVEAVGCAGPRAARCVVHDVGWARTVRQASRRLSV